jgi:hypothetical protein
MPYSGPYQAPRTWRQFLLRVAAIAIAAGILLSLYDLIQAVQTPHQSPVAPAQSQPHTE